MFSQVNNFVVFHIKTQASLFMALALFANNCDAAVLKMSLAYFKGLVYCM